MEIKEYIETNFIGEAPSEKFKEIHMLECEELLDNLGFVQIEEMQSTVPIKVGRQELVNGVKQFRIEYHTNKNKLKKKYLLPEKPNRDLLTEEELDFFEELCSLEGNFKLHEYSMSEIKSNPLLIRVLNFRMWALNIFDVKINSVFYEDTEAYLSKIGRWCGTNNHKLTIEVIGDIELLFEKIVTQTKFVNSSFKHIIYFNNKVDTKAERIFKFKNDPDRFKSRFEGFPDTILKNFNKTKKDKNQIEIIIGDELNQLMIRITQIRLWLLGMYQGRLDSNLGSFSLNAIKDTLKLYKSIYGNTQGFSINDVIVYLKNDKWAINSLFLNSFLKLLTQKGDNGVETISEEIENLYSAIEDQNKKEFLTEFNKILVNGVESEGKIKAYRKTKNRGVKSLYKTISSFIKKVIAEIRLGLQKVIDKLKSLFNWIKNGINIVYRELKKAYNLLSVGITFFFGKRKVKSENNNSSILTDFDFNFDSITSFQTTDRSLFKEQLQKCQDQIDALEEVSNFLGTVINIILKIVSGPLGWLSLGIEIIKWLSKNAFLYNRFSFNENITRTSNI